MCMISIHVSSLRYARCFLPVYLGEQNERITLLYGRVCDVHTPTHTRSTKVTTVLRTESRRKVSGHLVTSTVGSKRPEERKETL